MNILFVAQRYHPYPGGVETQTRLVVQELARLGHQVEVAALTFEKRSLSSRLAMLGDSLLIEDYEGYDDDGVPVHAMTPSMRDRLRMLPVAARAIPRLQRYRFAELRDFGYRFFRRVYVPRLRARMRDMDVVHSVAGGYFGWAAQEAARELGIPFVCTPYVHPGQHGDGPTDVRYYSRSDAVLALLETDRQVLIDLGVPAERVHLYGVVPLLPERADPGGFRERHGLGEAPVVLFVGSMAEYKGYRQLMAAADPVWRHHPEAHFLFIGPGSDALVDEFERLDNRIRYLGFVSLQEKADALAACDIFCMPSSFEILPAVYLEAWSYGKPVVGGPANGLKKLIEGNDAGVVVEQDGLAIAEVLDILLGQPGRCAHLGEQGRLLVEDRYSVAGLTGILESIYSRLGSRAIRTS